MLPTQVVRLEAACGEWFHSRPRAPWSVLGPHSWSADLCTDGTIRCCWLCPVRSADFNQPRDEGRHQEVSLTIHVRASKFAREIKPVSLERSILLQ